MIGWHVGDSCTECVCVWRKLLNMFMAAFIYDFYVSYVHFVVQYVF